MCRNNEMRSIQRKLENVFPTEIIEYIKQNPANPFYKICYRNGIDTFFESLVISFEYALNQIEPEILTAYINNNSHRLLGDSVDNRFVETYSVMSEIRALGYLCGCGLVVQPLRPIQNNDGTPDFHIIHSNTDVHIEVHTKCFIENAQTVINHGRKKSNSRDTHCAVIQEITPYGRPGAGENVTENCISKICGIKGSEHQASQDGVNILWLDFCNPFMNPDGFVPISSWRGQLYSGCLWYAFYGKEGLPIYELFDYEIEYRNFTVMRHNGRFLLSSLYDYAVVVCPNVTAIFENHMKTKNKTTPLLERLFSLLNFRFECSHLNFPDDTLKTRINTEYSRLMRMKDIDFHRD